MEFLRGRDDRAADHVTVAVQILGRRVDHRIGPPLDRPLERGRQERVVGDDQRAGPLCVPADGFQIGDPEQGIARRLDQDQLRAGGEGCRHGVRVRQVDELDLEKTAPLEPVEEPERAAVAVVGGDDPVAGVEQLARQSDRGHAGGGDYRAVAALGLRERFGEGGARRVAGAGVVVRPLAVEAVEGEVGRQVQWRDDRAVLRVGSERRAHGAGCRGGGSKSCEPPVEKGVGGSRKRDGWGALSRRLLRRVNRRRRRVRGYAARLTHLSVAPKEGLP